MKNNIINNDSVQREHVLHGSNSQATKRFVCTYSFFGWVFKLGILPSCKPKPSADCYFDVFRNQLFKLALRLIVVLRIHKLLNFGQWY
jgi:hypothetical protein